MATKAEPVTSDHAGEPGVQEVITNVPGVGDIKAYFLVTVVDDLDGKTTEDVQTLRVYYPRETKLHHRVLDEAGNGTGETRLETKWDYIPYEVDLGPESREKLLDAFLDFVNVGREVTETSRPASGQTSIPAQSTGPDPAKVRAWAQENGIEVNAKGRVPHSVIAQYEKAQQESADA
ncbi:MULTISPECIES: Lsr2 family protein [unclassified Streptomyces]|uniref:histone-like nucleoid-structuring protein Lsr2 n=1 Tax=unclassified Streptomyces TaxID=2593676 RepID=UPI0024739E4F|nr:MULTISPECIES: Lsr2 family protein [unclassified Streptomyces]